MKFRTMQKKEYVPPFKGQQTHPNEWVIIDTFYAQVRWWGVWRTIRFNPKEKRGFSFAKYHYSLKSNDPITTLHDIMKFRESKKQEKVEKPKTKFYKLRTFDIK